MAKKKALKPLPKRKSIARRVMRVVDFWRTKTSVKGRKESIKFLKELIKEMESVDRQSRLRGR